MRLRVVLMMTGVLASAVCVEAQTDEPKCSNETLKGAYGLQLAGTRPGPGFAGQYEQVAGTVIQVFDGNGNFTQIDNVKGSISGITPDRPGKGTYTVSADCTLIQTVKPAPGIELISKGVVVDGGKGFFQNTLTPAAVNVAAVGRKIN